MARINFTDGLKKEYIQLYRTMEISQDKLNIVNNHVDHILQSKDRYQEIEDSIGVPWFITALLHTMESSRNFKTHLHNGDPLSKRTTHVPAGRPINGNPPFSWEESATDALKQKKLDKINDWGAARILYQIESYNGWGYRRFHPEVKSPYLWSYSNHYTRGKYVADGKFSKTAVSKQSGAITILKRMEERKEVSALSFEDIDVPFFHFTNGIANRAKDLQRFLNTFDGISLTEDGRPGNGTSEACFKLFGNYLDGDTRGK